MEDELIEEFNAQRDERLLSVPAKRLIEKLTPLSSHVEAYQKRWFWELLQNACDNNENVKIQVEIQDDWLYFRHNGHYFTIKDTMNLIFPDSAKDDGNKSDVIGQFGTGFISTHILCSKITVSGILQNKNQELYPFKFTLDRSNYAEKSLLQGKLADAEKELRASKKATVNPTGEYLSEFAYDLNSPYEFSDPGDAIKNGVKFIKAALPYVFTFVSQLERVEIITKEKSFFYTRLKNGNSGCHYERIGADPIQKDLIVRSAKVGETEVAIRTTDNKVIDHKEIPILFCGYPMLGTETFPFPCIINNNQFVPKIERNGIELSKNDKINKAIIEEAVKAYSQLLSNISSNTQEIYNACALKSGSFEIEDQQWFKTAISDALKKSILENEIVSTKDGKKKLQDTYIPNPETEETFDSFFEICENTTYHIPVKEEAKNWNKVLNFAVFTEEKLDLKKLIEEAAKNKLSDLLHEGINKTKWVAKLLEYTIDYQKQVLLEKNALIPVKSGKLRTSKNDLYWNDAIDEKLIEIHDLLKSESYEEILLHKDVERLGEKLLPTEKKKTEKDISHAIDKVFNPSLSPKINSNFIDALQKLFAWTDGMEYVQLIDYFPIFFPNRAKFMLDTLENNYERNLAFDIIKSEKKDVLSRIAKSEITIKELETLVENEKAFKLFLKWKNSFVNDSEKASAELGDIGEIYLYDKLKKRFDGITGYEVEWVAKTRNEANYDFEIRKNGKAYLFIDAKTTNQGISNTDTVPFFMRRGQWDFLSTMEKNQAYYIGRIFVENEDQINVRFLNIKPQEPSSDANLS
jgi:hypothetical protein